MSPRVLLLGLIAIVAPCACSGPPDSGSTNGDETGSAEIRLDYGPILRSVDAHSARFLFHAARPDGTEATWSAGIEIGPAEELGRDTPIRVPQVEVDESTDFVAHLVVEGLESQTRYTYVPLVNGRRALDDPERFPSFVTAPDLAGRNADFNVVLLADQHTPDGPERPTFAAYAAAAESRPLFWAQLGDVAASTPTPGLKEEQRTRANIREIWRRNYGERSSPQARFVGSHALNLATISDHELMDNFSMNWHHSFRGIDGEATSHDRVDRYDRSVGTWWNYFGWGARQDGALGTAALEDHGESVMAEPPVSLLEDCTRAEVCIESSAARDFDAGSFVYLVDDEGDAFHSRISEISASGSCGDGRGTTLKLAEPAPRSYGRDSGARIAKGGQYAPHGHYGAYRPFPYVEFFLLDTTSYRGDPYQERELYAREANRDKDHSRYPWDAAGGHGYIYGDRDHGANRTTDGVRSWLGPTQKTAFLEDLGGSTAEILVVAAGYPLYSAKFEWSKRYWEGRECGFDFAAELDEIVAALEKTGKLVLWVHGDGHTPMLVRLRPNLYQLQVGPTLMGHTDTPGHRSRTLSSGDASKGDLLGGGRLIAGHQPDLQLGDENEDFFSGHLEQFEGYLELYFHPGREVLRNAERSGLRRAESDHVVEIPAEHDPARGAAARRIVGRVVRLEFGELRRHSVVTAYGYANGRVRIELKDPVVTRDPDVMRVIVDGDPWVQARWFDARGREWREFSSVLRREP